MTFLSPIPALIAAAITVPALLFFYFLKLRRRPVRVSTATLSASSVFCTLTSCQAVAFQTYTSV